MKNEKSESLEITTRTAEAPLQLARRDAEVPSVTQMLQSAIDKGASPETLEKFVNLYERMEQRDAEKQFNAAFVQLQKELPVIVAKTVIPQRGKYERFEDVMQAIAEPLSRNGFTVSFSMDFREGRVIETCCLRHRGGYSQSNSFAVRTGKADTDTQADCKAATTAKRNALLNCLNIVIRQDALLGEDGDASLEGEFISSDKAKALRERVIAAGGNEAAFLATAGAKSYEEICNGSYGVLTRMLDAKERAKK
jgi:hypothetical protein